MNGEPSYKRQIDFWIKLMTLISPLLCGGVTWGIMQGQLSGIKESVSEIKGWIRAHDQYTMASIKETGEMIQQLKNLNEKLWNIQVAVDKRLK